MKTRSEKRRGRPRKEGLREPNGRISRAEEPPHKLAIEARAKMLGISVIEAVDPLGATFIGSLHMAYKRWVKTPAEERPENPPSNCLTTKQYDAILKFLELRNQALKVFDAEGAEYDARPAYSTAPVFSDAEVAEKAEAIKRRYTAAREAIQKYQDVNRQENLWAAVDLVIIRGQRMEHLIGATRHVGNALTPMFKT